MASIQERNGSYRITVSCGYDIYGKKLIKTMTFTPDPALTPKRKEKAVREFAQQFESRVKNGFAMDGRKITLKEFTDRWMEEYAKVNLQPGTITKYEEEINDKILPTLGHLKLSELKPHIINAFFASFTKDGARKDGKPGGYSKGTIMKTRNVLSSILRTATEWEIIDNNPCDKVRLQTENTAEKLKFFTPEQTIAFLNYIEEPYQIQVGGHQRIDDTGIPYTVPNYELTRTIPEQMKILFQLAIYGGLRKGELLALTFDDLDAAADQLHISRAVTVVNGKQICKAPKTRTSNRIISIPHFLTERIELLHQARLELQAKIGDYWEGDNNWIFTQDNGKMMSYSTPYHALQDIILRYNKNRVPEETLPVIPFHGLRHTSATLLIASKQSISTVSRRMGHAQTSTTMNIYVHALQKSDQEAADTLETLLGSGNKS